MSLVTRKNILFPFVVFALFCHSVFADDTSFRNAQLSYGISLDIPSHWTILSQDSRKNLRAAGQAMIDNAGLEGLSSRKESLLAVNAKPNPTGAIIRVSITLPPDYTQNYLASLTRENLKEMTIETLNIFRNLEASGGLKVVELQPARIEIIKNYRALVISYVRASNNSSSFWQVTQYKIPTHDKIIEITLSYRKPDAVVWKPILERVKQSLRF